MGLRTASTREKSVFPTSERTRTLLLHSTELIINEKKEIIRNFPEVSLKEKEKNRRHNKTSNSSIVTSSNYCIRNTRRRGGGENNDQNLPFSSNESISGNMAPALTEPISQSNKLSSSTSSASPRPVSNNQLLQSNNSNSINNLTTNNNSEDGGNNLNSIGGASNGSGSPTSENILLLNSENSATAITATAVVFKGNDNSSNNIFNKNRGAFQLAFEEVVARQTGTRRKDSPATVPAEANAPAATADRHNNKPMGPMCDKTVSDNILDFEKELDKTRIAGVVDSNGGGDTQINNTNKNQVNLKSDSKKNSNLIRSNRNHMDFEDRDDDAIVGNKNENELSEEGIHETLVLCEESSIECGNGNVSTTAASNSRDAMLSSNEGSRSTEDGKFGKFAVEGGRSMAIESLSQPYASSLMASPMEESKNNNNNNHKKSPIQRTLTSSSITLSSPQTQQQMQQLSLSQQQQQQQAQQGTTPLSCLTPQSTTSSGMGLQKDFIKDANEMDQVLGEMDILQVLKGFDTTSTGETLCELAGSLGLFNDVDVMTYEEMGTPAQNSETREIRLEIEKRQQQMQRKCDFLLRRLRKFQARYMGKHASEEVTGLFEWTNRIVRRKDHEPNRQISFDEDRHRPVSTASMRAFLKRIDSVATAQHTCGQPKTDKGSKLPASPTPEQQTKSSVISIVPQFDEKSTEEIDYVSGMLQTELKQIQVSLDSDVTASSSGGESADEMVTYNNQTQQPLSIAKRAAWRWATDRAAIASRWTWLLAQISDLEYRIRQHTELHHQIKKNKAAVTFERVPSSESPEQQTVENVLETVPSSVNGYRGVLPGNSKTMEVNGSSGVNDSNDNTSGACRTRPFQRAGFRKRKLLQTANIHTVSKKAARPSTIKCGCHWPLHPCALCTGRSDPTAPRDLPDTMTPAERVALLDPGFHPVLSFPEDISHSIHIEGVACLQDWQNRVLRCSSKSFLKGAVAAQKAAEREDRSKKYLESRRKQNRKYTSQDILAANKLKNAKNRRAPYPPDQYNNHLKNKLHRKTTTSSSSSNAGDILTLDGKGHIAGENQLGEGGFQNPSSGNVFHVVGDDLEGTNGLPRSKNSSPTPGSHSGSSHKSERSDRRNHRNSYDIDNIVIPYSVAAATRVEILPYKEIPTPKWRIIDETTENNNNNDAQNDSKVFNKSSGTVIIPIKADTDKNSNQQELNNSQGENSTISATNSMPSEMVIDDSTARPATGDETEDISDEAIHTRHERALLEERKKFQTFLKFPWSTRSRANRRIDSRAESSGANTPDPTSPAPNTPNATGDQESIPSPAAPSTPLNPLDSGEINENSQANHLLPNNISNSAARRYERKRTVSLKKEHSREEPRRSSTPDSKEIIPPFEPLQFPLSDELYETMLQLMPNDHQLMEDCLKSNTFDGGGDNVDKNSMSESGDLLNCTTNKNESIITNHLNSSCNHNQLLDGINNDKNFSSGFTSKINNISHGGNLSPATKVNEMQKLMVNSTTSHSPFISSTRNVNIYDSSGFELITFDSQDSLMGCASDTDSAESGLLDEDPNDPEWKEPT